MERKRFKENSVATTCMVEKEECEVMQTCFEELHLLIPISEWRKLSLSSLYCRVITVTEILF